MKQLLVLLFLIFGVGELTAQNKLRLGLTASPNIGWINPDTRGVDSDGSRLGFKYGVIVDYSFAENYALSTGAFINHMGGKIKFPEEISSNSFGSSESVVKLQYVDLPISLKLRTNEIGYITYFGQIGFEGSINIGAKTDLKSFDSNGKEVFSADNEKISDEIKLFRASLVVGIGAEYNISGNTSIVGGLSFHNGFTNIFDFDVPKTDKNGQLLTTGETQKVKANNNFISLDIGVLF